MRRDRRPLLAPLFALLTLSATACSGASAGWTYAPAPVTPVPSAAPSSSASAPAPSEAASGEPSAAPSASTPAGGTVIQISALGIKYEQAALEVAANAPFQIEFENKDAGVPHNVSIHQGDASGAEVFQGAIFPGVATKTYDVGALPAGAYAFACTVHPTMTGTLTVK
jgi:plastocyanin